MVKADGSKLSLFELMIHLQRDLIVADEQKRSQAEALSLVANNIEVTTK
jgi:hypothetical protein